MSAWVESGVSKPLEPVMCETCPEIEQGYATRTVSTMVYFDWCGIAKGITWELCDVCCDKMIRSAVELEAKTSDEP